MSSPVLEPARVAPPSCSSCGRSDDAQGGVPVVRAIELAASPTVSSDTPAVSVAPSVDVENKAIF